MIYRCSEVYIVLNLASTIYHSEATVYDEFVFVYR